MDWSELFKIIGITTGPQILLVIIIGFWGKKLIEYFFAETIEVKKKELEQDLENHKQNLERENRNLQLSLDKNLEAYKSRLEILRLEFQVQFAELHAKRSEIIAELYKYLTELNASMLNLTARIHGVVQDAEKEEQKRIERANKAYIEFYNYYYPHRIFFSQIIASKLDKIQAFVWDKAWDFNYIKGQIGSGQLDPSSWKSFSDDLKKISKEVHKEIPDALKDLEDEFRELLGVNAKTITEQLKEKVEE